MYAHVWLSLVMAYVLYVSAPGKVLFKLSMLDTVHEGLLVTL